MIMQKKPNPKKVSRDSPRSFEQGGKLLERRFLRSNHAKKVKDLKTPDTKEAMGFW
jgi:hypothetical protein